MHPLVQHGDDADVAVREAAPIDEMPLVAEEITFHTEGSGNEHIEKAPQEFEIDMLRCIYCGMCQEVCPEEAIFLQNKFTLNGLSRQELVFNKQRLYEAGGIREDEHFKWKKKKEAEAHGNAHH